MRGLCSVLGLGLAVFLGAFSSVQAADKIADVVSATPSFTAGGQALKAGSTVSGGQRVSTSGSGRGELLFVDGTRLALGPSSSMVISTSLMRGKNKFSKLGLVASRGAFRWISGSSGSSAYALSTPISTIGIRGTALDITVRGGKTYVALLSGGARICGGGGCQQLMRTCDYVEIGRGISKTQQIGAGFKTRTDAARAFPYQANPGLLSSRFRVSGGNCLNRAAFNGKAVPPPAVRIVQPPPPPPPPPPREKCDGAANCGKNGNGTPNEGQGNGRK
jgi:hypothetical protein